MRQVELWGTIAKQEGDKFVWQKGGFRWTWRAGLGINTTCNDSPVAYFRSCREAMIFAEGWEAGRKSPLPG